MFMLSKWINLKALIESSANMKSPEEHAFQSLLTTRTLTLFS